MIVLMLKPSLRIAKKGEEKFNEFKDIRNHTKNLFKHMYILEINGSQRHYILAW